MDAVVLHLMFNMAVGEKCILVLCPSLRRGLVGVGAEDLEPHVEPELVKVPKVHPLPIIFLLISCYSHFCSVK